jgi:hypothetical protein
VSDCSFRLKPSNSASSGAEYTLAAEGATTLFSFCPDGAGYTVLAFNTTGLVARGCYSVELLVTIGEEGA